jgi:hypothetical protein
MIVTLVAQTKSFSQGLQKAGKSALTFGSVLKTGMSLAFGAITALAGALFAFLPNFIRMGEEARKSELRLTNIATQMGLFGDNTKNVTERLSDYAEAISFATGVDDELVRSAEAILLTFKQLAKTADTTGGAFDRATIAAIDLAAAGFGDAESNAKQLGKALQDPIKGLTALRKAGVTFTDAEKKKIKALVESGNLLKAQEVILGAIETQVGGTAAATASATDKMNARFEAVVETMSLALLPAVDEIAQQMTEWLDSVEGKKAIEDLTKQLKEFGAWVTSAEGSQAIKDFANNVAALATAAINVGKGFQAVYTALKQVGDWFSTPGGKAWVKNFGGGSSPNFDVPIPIGPPTVSGGGNVGRPNTPGNITVNFMTPVDSVSAGREVARVLSDYNRARGRQ